MGAHGKDTAHFHPSFDTYIKVFSALICLTIATVASSRFDFGGMNAVIAFTIATTKALLVMAFFMHLRYDDKMNRIIIAAAFFFLAVLLFFCDLDNFTRVVQHSTL